MKRTFCTFMFACMMLISSFAQISPDRGNVKNTTSRPLGKQLTVAVYNKGNPDKADSGRDSVRAVSGTNQLFYLSDDVEVLRYHPDSVVYYDLNGAIEKRFYTWSSSNKLLSEEQYIKEWWFEQGWRLYLRDTYEYDAADSLIVFEEHSWDGTTFRELAKEDYSYDQGRKTTNIHSWNSTNNTWVLNVKKTTAGDDPRHYTYNEEINYYDGIINFGVRYINEYNAQGLSILDESYYWDTFYDRWQANSKLIRDYNNKGSNTLEEYYSWNISANSWIPSSQFRYLYNEKNDKIQDIQSYWDVDSRNWIPSSYYRYDYVYDSKGNKINLTEYSGYPFNEKIINWSFSKMSKWNYMYDEKNRIIQKDYYPNVWDFENTKEPMSTREIYAYNESDSIVNKEYLENHYTYDSENVRIDNLIHVRREVKNFDADNNQILYEDYYYLSDGELIGSSKQAKEFDSERRILKEESYYWDGSNHVWYPNARNDYRYGSSGKIIQNISYYGGVEWLPATKMQYIYDQGTARLLYQRDYLWNNENAEWNLSSYNIVYPVLTSDVLAVTESVGVNAVNRVGKIELAFILPENSYPIGSFVIKFPTGLSLDAFSTLLTEEFELTNELEVIYLGSNRWQINIKSLPIRSATASNSLRKIMNIGYIAAKTVNPGVYQIDLQDINFELNNEEVLIQDNLSVNVNVFTDITTGINTDNPDVAPVVYTKEAQLYIYSKDAESIDIYSVNGIKLFSAEKQQGEYLVDASLPKGVFFVKGSTGWVKKMVN